MKFNEYMAKINLNSVVIYILLLFSIVLSLYNLVILNPKNSNRYFVNSISNFSSSPSNSPFTSPEILIENNDTNEFWPRFSNQIYSFSYPTYATVEKNSEVTKLQLLGPSSEPAAGFGITDGIYMTFNYYSLAQGKTLKDIIKDDASKSSGPDEIILSAVPFDLDERWYDGYVEQSTYQQIYYIISKNYPVGYVKIDVTTNDPNDLGYQKIIETIVKNVRTKHFS